MWSLGIRKSWCSGGGQELSSGIKHPVPQTHPNQRSEKDLKRIQNDPVCMLNRWDHFHDTMQPRTAMWGLKHSYSQPLTSIPRTVGWMLSSSCASTVLGVCGEQLTEQRSMLLTLGVFQSFLVKLQISASFVSYDVLKPLGKRWTNTGPYWCFLCRRSQGPASSWLLALLDLFELSVLKPLDGWFNFLQSELRLWDKHFDQTLQFPCQTDLNIWKTTIWQREKFDVGQDWIYKRPFVHAGPQALAESINDQWLSRS